MASSKTVTLFITILQNVSKKLNNQSRIKHLFTIPNTDLGRWKPVYKHDINEIKIYQANMDHCGTCAKHDKSSEVKRSNI